jgi:hypothetical protein
MVGGMTVALVRWRRASRGGQHNVRDDAEQGKGPLIGGPGWQWRGVLLHVLVPGVERGKKLIGGPVRFK